MGRCSPICERVRKKIVAYVKVQRLCKSHRLQSITSLKYSEKQKKSVRKGQSRRLVLDVRGLWALR